MAKHIHVHLTRDADHAVDQAKAAAERAIREAQSKCDQLKSVLKDPDDKLQVDSVISFLRQALGKLYHEVLSGRED